MNDDINIEIAGTVGNWNVYASNNNNQTAVQGKGALMGEVNWTSRSLAWNQNTWRGITHGDYNGGRFVAIKHAGGPRVMYSDDGYTWSSDGVTGNGSAGWVGIGYGNGTYVAVADSGAGDRVMTSTDGVSWTTRSSANSFVNANQWQNVAYGNNTFVAVSIGGPGGIMYSTDNGVTWNASSQTAGRFSDVIFANGKFTAVGGGGVAESTDGINWTWIPISNSPPGAVGWMSVAYGNGTYLLTGSSWDGTSYMATSTDGTAWETKTPPENFTHSYNTKFGDGLWVIASGNTVRVSSDNGETWKTQGSDLIPAGQWLDGVAYGNGIFAVVGAPATVLNTP